VSGHLQLVGGDVVGLYELGQIFRTNGLSHIESVPHGADDVTVDGRVLAEGDGPDEVVVKADELLLEVQRPLVKPVKRFNNEIYN